MYYKISYKQQKLVEEEDPFFMHLAEAFLCANIPLNKLQHPAIKNFLPDCYPQYHNLLLVEEYWKKCI